MSLFEPDSTSLKTLKDKVVVLTGGAEGIGASLVTYLHSLGAIVIFGDINTVSASELLNSLNSPHVHFLPCDVRNYADQVALFKLAFSKYGRVDHAIGNAGVIEQGNWFDPKQSLADIENEPNTLTLDVDLKGVLFFSRIAAFYLAQNKGPDDDRSLTLVSSVAGFVESRALCLYSSSKHGVLGLMRSLRLYMPANFGIRVNAICPSMVLTAMVRDLKDAWVKGGLPVNTPPEVAHYIAGVMAAGPGVALNTIKSADIEVKNDPVPSMSHSGRNKWGEIERNIGLNGRALYIEGGRAWDIEERLDRTRHLWLGRGPEERLASANTLMEAGLEEERLAAS